VGLIVPLVQLPAQQNATIVMRVSLLTQAISALVVQQTAKNVLMVIIVYLANVQQGIRMMEMINAPQFVVMIVRLAQLPVLESVMTVMRVSLLTQAMSVLVVQQTAKNVPMLIIV